MNRIVLKGMTWNHSRGIIPLLATSQRFCEINPGIEIFWEKRSLQEFADSPIEKLAKDYDLLIIDHPWVGSAESSECVVPLDSYLSEEFLENQSFHQVGLSHDSYFYGLHQWALAIDAAAPVASYRKDLFEQHNINLPDTLDDIVELAKEGMVAVPSDPIDSLMNFYMFCIAMDETPFKYQNRVISRDTGQEVLEKMKKLWSFFDPELFDFNPIRLAEIMASSDKYWYCPFSYGYSNYSRKGYASKLLTYGDLVTFNGKGLKSTLGGAGLAVSSYSPNITSCIKYAAWVASPEVQSGIYVRNGGQPGYRKVWENEEANYLSNNFFKNTIKTLDSSYMRPRYNGYLFFQDKAGDEIQSFLKGEITSTQTLDRMDNLYNASLKKID